MPTETLFLDDAYRKSAPARVVGQTEEGGIILDRSIFYARGGGQPGDSGTLDWSVDGDAGRIGRRHNIDCLHAEYKACNRQSFACRLYYWKGRGCRMQYLSCGCNDQGT